jgi:hypothetical protein
MNKVTNFMKQTLAILKGDDAGVISAKNERKANSALNGQIAALKAKEVDLESNVEDAKETLKLAKFPKDVITNNTFYIDNIKSANSKLEDAVFELEECKDSIKFYESIKEEFEKEVEVEA